MSLFETQAQAKPPGFNPEIGVCILNTGLVDIKWAMNMFHLFVSIGRPFGYLLASNQPYDVSREMATRAFLQQGVKYIFHFDSDVLPPPQTIPTLISVSEQMKQPVVSGVYWAKKKEGRNACAWVKHSHNSDTNTTTYVSFKIEPYLNTNMLIRVEGVVGAGCLMINTDVLRQLDKKNPNKPFFEWGMNRKYLDGKPMFQHSEDFYFCERLIQELGVYPHVFPGIKCGHICTTQLKGEDGSFELI